MEGGPADRTDPLCPICRMPKHGHTPEQARICFAKIRDKSIL